MCGWIIENNNQMAIMANNENENNVWRNGQRNENNNVAICNVI